MEPSDKSSQDLLGLIKSWLPWRSESTNVSRDFWMPDQSCRVCYDCDSQFTLFNRRHHCRLCGRVFCGKCTSHWVPASSEDPRTTWEERERIRVCNYCFKQWEQGLDAALVCGTPATGLDPSGSSLTSFISTKSSGTVDSSNVTLASVSQSAGLSSHQSAVMEATRDRQNVTTTRSNDPVADIEYVDHSPDHFEYCMSRLFDDDDEFGVNDFYSHLHFDEMENDYGSHKIHPDGDAIESKSPSSSSPHNSIDSQASEEVQQIVKKEGVQDIDASESSSVHVAEDVEPVDFENNGVLWLPPEPEDEEDERETLLSDDDDEGDATGEWGYSHASSSSCSEESRSKDRSTEEHKTEVKNVVDGHFRALVAQLLQVENLLVGEEGDSASWLEIITSLSWEAATLLKPDTSKGGGMDPGGYVKVKCLASGRRSDSMVVKGIVCKKNVAHRRMTSKIEKPRILILGGALEYQRVSNHLSSFDTLLQQEMDHLKMAVAKIDAYNPDILLVEKSVSRYAQEYLLAKDISLVLNIKRPLLERIARCTGSQIVSSIDHMSTQKLGYCDKFHLEKFLEEHGTAGQGGKKLMKTLMYFEGCPKPLGCTVLLRGANGDELKKLKHVVQYGVFAAYHLALETSFLADEGASLPELPLNSLITVALPDKTSAIDRSISTIPGFTVTDELNPQGNQCTNQPLRSNSVPTSNLVKGSDDSVNKTGKMECLSTAISSQLLNPNVASSKQDVSISSIDDPSSRQASDKKTVVRSLDFSGSKIAMANTVLYERGDPLIPNAIGQSDALGREHVSDEVRNGCSAFDANQGSTDTSLMQLEVKQSSEEPKSLKEEYLPSPSDHQRILVSLSSRCVWKGTVCERSHLFRIKYYGSSDKPLGRFLRDHLFDQNYRCLSCEMPSEAHVQCYTHQQGSLTISVKKLPEFLLPGEKEGKIWMWHRCLRCSRINGFPPATRRVVMSDAAWGLSFGKFLELSFSNHAAASRVATCGHSLHRDCIRFYGFGKMVACFRYAAIDVHSAFLPPPKLDFNYEKQDWIQRELDEVVARAELMFSEVLNALNLMVKRRSGTAQLNTGTKLPPSRRQISELEGMVQREKEEFEESIKKIPNKEAKEGQPVVDILEINRLRRQLLFQSYMWDNRLIYAANLDNKIEEDDMDIDISEPVTEPICNAEPIDPSKLVESEKDLVCLDKVLVDAKTDESHEQVVHQGVDTCVDSDEGGNLSSVSLGTSTSRESDPLMSNVVDRRALSDGQNPTVASLSDTLDAAWTGENQSVIGIAKDVLSESAAAADSLTAPGAVEKLEVENHGVDLTGSKVSQCPPLVSSKVSDNIEDNVSWLGMPFVSFYRSLNKSFMGDSQKLDTFNDYNPVYISSFRESELQGGARLLLPVGVNDTVVPIYDDEPTSVISYVLVCPDYLVQLSNEHERTKEGAESLNHSQSLDLGHSQSFHLADEVALESYKSLGSASESVLSTGSRDPKPLHARVSFGDDGSLGKVTYTVTCYYATQFDSLRKICCPTEMDYVRSLSRCKKWGAQGGKSNVFFAKTLDDRFIIKQVTKTELESFMKFAPHYFSYLSESIETRSPTCLARILGIYQVTSKHQGGKESKMDLLVMENLLYRRTLTRLYDLKGSTRSRYNPDSSGNNKVLLDQNLIEAMPTAPIFVGNKAKRLLERAVWNDTAFLASIDVMDYSLLVGVDEEKHELVLGIIDFMRQYTWDKHLETWVKSSGILGGPRNASPTVISPKQYKKRFRKAMTTYFLMVPDQWSPPTVTPSKSQTDLFEDNAQGGTSTG